MADLITRPDSRPAIEPESPGRVAGRAPPRHAVAAAPAVVAAHPDRGRRAGRRGLRGPDDPRGLPRQRHRDPDPLLRAEAAGFGACRMCVVEVEGEEHPPISCSRACEPEMKVQTQTEELRRLRRTNLELIFSRPQRLLPAAVPEQVPEPHRHPGLPQGQRRGRLAREHPHLQAHDPVPQRPRPRLPGAVRGALPARRGRRGDRHPRQPPLRRRPGPQGDARRGRGPAAAVRAPGAVRADGRGHRLGAGRDGRRVLPAARRPRRDGLRARPVARRDAPLRDPAVPPAQGRGPRGRVRVGHPARRQDRLQRRSRHATSRSTT